MNNDKIEQELDSLISHAVGDVDTTILSKQIDDRRLQMLIKAYETAVETRQFEIELFWKRSLFFWGFIASSFVAYATLMPKSLSLSIVIACFGFICSFAWSLNNRGSKFWQETWELKVHRIEPMVTGAMFFRHEPEAEPKKNDKKNFRPWIREFSMSKDPERKDLWLQRRMFSVSKLAIALSDYTVALWFALILVSLVSLYIHTFLPLSDHGLKYYDYVKACAVTLFAILSVLYGCFALRLCRHIPPDYNKNN